MIIEHNFNTPKTVKRKHTKRPDEAVKTKCIMLHLRKDFTQKGIAEELGVSQNYVSKIINGVRRINTPAAKEIKRRISQL